MLVQWARLQFPDILIAASANGGSRNKIEAKNLKLQGVVSGIPDLQVFCARRGFHGLFLEMKAPKTPTSEKGRLSMVQKACLNYLNSHGYYAIACWGFDEGKRVIEWYLNEQD